MRHLRGLDLLFTIMVYSILLLAAAMAIFPLFYVLSVSFSTEYEYLTRGFFVIPKQFTLDGYLYLLSHPGFISAFRNAVIISAVGTALNIVLTSLMAYGLSKRWLKFRNSLNFMVFYDAVLGRHDTNLFGRPIASSSGQLLGHLVKHGDCSF